MKICKNCNTMVDGEENVCPNCGGALTEAAEANSKNTGAGLLFSGRLRGKILLLILSILFLVVGFVWFLFFIYEPYWWECLYPFLPGVLFFFGYIATTFTLDVYEDRIEVRSLSKRGSRDVVAVPITRISGVSKLGKNGITVFVGDDMKRFVFGKMISGRDEGYDVILKQILKWQAKNANH